MLDNGFVSPLGWPPSIWPVRINLALNGFTMSETYQRRSHFKHSPCLTYVLNSLGPLRSVTDYRSCPMLTIPRLTSYLPSQLLPTL